MYFCSPQICNPNIYLPINIESIIWHRNVSRPSRKETKGGVDWSGSVNFKSSPSESNIVNDTYIIFSHKAKETKRYILESSVIFSTSIYSALRLTTSLLLETRNYQQLTILTDYCLGKTCTWIVLWHPSGRLELRNNNSKPNSRIPTLNVHLVKKG